MVEPNLGAAGVHIVCVENGAEAVAAFRTDTVDLILMDMPMPVVDGLTAIADSASFRSSLAGLHADPRPHGQCNAGAVLASLGAGADGRLAKPIAADQFLERVAEAI